MSLTLELDDDKPSRFLTSFWFNKIHIKLQGEINNHTVRQNDKNMHVYHPNRNILHYICEFQVQMVIKKEQ